MISVLLPSRGRPRALAEAVASLRDRAADPDRIEILIAADPDDPATVDTAHHLEADVVHVADRRHGYAGLHHYINDLAPQARGAWLMLFNDDARVLTDHWDAIARAETPAVLWPDSNDIPGCNTFPLWPRAWTQRLGHVSLSPHCDSWIQHLGTALGRHRRVPIRILHDRADLTGGHDDHTRAESLAGYRTADYHAPALRAARDADVALLREEGL